MYEPDKSVIDFIKTYNSRLSAWGNPWTDAKDESLVIGYHSLPINAMRCVDGVDGLFVSRRVGFPVLYFPEVDGPDSRITGALERGKISVRRDLELEARNQQIKEYEDQRTVMGDWSRDVGYWYYKKMVDEYNFSCISNKDPLRADKEYEDRYGRRKGWR